MEIDIWDSTTKKVVEKMQEELEKKNSKPDDVKKWLDILKEMASVKAVRFERITNGKGETVGTLETGIKNTLDLKEAMNEPTNTPRKRW